MGQNYCICGCDSKATPLEPLTPPLYDRNRIEQYIAGAVNMIDDDDRYGFIEGIKCALNELDMMMPKEDFDPSDPFNQRVNYLEGKNKSSIELPVTLTLAQKGWEYAQMLSDEAKAEKKDGWDSEYKLVAQAYKGDWGDPDSYQGSDEPLTLEVTKAHSWALADWDEDEKGGPGLYISTIFKSPKGKSYTVSTIIPKDELIKALGLLTRF